MTGKIRLLPILVVMLTSTLGLPMLSQGDHSHMEMKGGTGWSALMVGMDKMHATMDDISPSGNPDVDFVKLMLPHHQAAIDMAKAELVYGKDPQMRRLAQEVITDQQSEIELMQMWLKQHESH